MAKVINSQALEPVNKALGLAGAGDSQTELMDGIVDQVLDVGPIVRRGQTLSNSEGIFRAVFRNVHAASDLQSSVWSPYVSVPALIIPPFPTPVTPSYDLWLYGASVQRQAGTGTCSAGITIQNIRQGWGATEAGAPVVANNRIILAFWNTQASLDSNVFLLNQTMHPHQRLDFRVPRVSESGTRVQIFFESASSAASTWELNLLFGMFPLALGQDGAF